MHGSYKSRTNDPCRRLHPFQLGDPATLCVPLEEPASADCLNLNRLLDERPLRGCSQF